MNLFNKILANFYFILSILWLFFGFSQFKGYNTRIIDAVFILSIFMGILIFGLIHRRISNNALGILREKFFVACSSVNLAIIFMGAFLIDTACNKLSCVFGNIFQLLFWAPIFIVPSFLALFFGIASVFKINRKVGLKAISRC